MAAKKKAFTTALKTIIPQKRSGLLAPKPKTRVSFDQARRLAEEASLEHSTPYVHVDPKTAEVRVSDDGETWRWA